MERWSINGSSPATARRGTRLDRGPRRINSAGRPRSRTRTIASPPGSSARAIPRTNGKRHRNSRSRSLSRPFPVDSVALTTSLPAPQPAGSTIVWTATATGGTGALVYKWFVTDDGVTWNAVGSWTSSNQFSWTPTVANANYRVSAWVKRASNPTGRMGSIIGTAIRHHEPSFPVSSVALTTDLPAPQEVRPSSGPRRRRAAPARWSIMVRH